MILRIASLFGLAMFLVGAASNFQFIPMPVDLSSIPCAVGPAAFSMDVVLMVLGIFIMLVSWAFNKLAQ